MENASSRMVVGHYWELSLHSLLRFILGSFPWKYGLLLTISFVVLLGCRSTSKTSPARSLQPGLSDAKMQSSVEEIAIGIDESTVRQLLESEGFINFSVTPQPDNTKSIWCMREDRVSTLVTKKWNLTLSLDKDEKVSSISVSSGLVGP